MSGYLIDTDWIIDALHGLPVAVETLTALTPSGVAVSLITYGELYEGSYHNRDPVTALANLRRILHNKPLLPLTTSIMETFGIVRGQLSRNLRQQIGDMDLLIAATALTHDLTLLTRNLRDFQHIPNLSLHCQS